MNSARNGGAVRAAKAAQASQTSQVESLLAVTDLVGKRLHGASLTVRKGEIVALAAVLGVVGAIIAAVGAWYDLRRRAIGLTSDEQAAALLGESLGQC